MSTRRMESLRSKIANVLVLICAFIAARPASGGGDLSGAEAGFAFPVNESSVEWQNLSTAQKIAVSQIPDEALRLMSTADLVQTCLRIPIRGLFVFHDPYSNGIDRLVSLCNGLRELVARPDAGTELITAYGAIPLGPVDKDISAKDRLRSLRELSFVELLLSREDVMASLSATEQEELLRTLVDRYPDRCPTVILASDVVDGLIGRATSSLVRGLPGAEPDKDNETTQFLAGESRWTPAISAKVLERARNVLDQLSAMGDSHE